MAKVAEIINLDSDDDEVLIEEKEKKKKSCNANCINFKCSSGVDMRLAPTFACSYYGVNMTKKKKRFICRICLDIALDHQEQLINALTNHKPILKCEFPDHTMEVEISDSDESDAEVKNESDEYLSEDTLRDFEEKVKKSLADALEKYDINYQIEEANAVLKSEINDLKESNDKLDADICKTMQKLDQQRSMLYDEFKPSIKMLEELKIEDCIGAPNPLVVSKKVPQNRQQNNSIVQDSQPEILQEVERDNRLLQDMHLPPSGRLIKPVPGMDEFVKNLNGKQMAACYPSPVIIPVGTRVVAMFQDTYSSNYYSGVIAEPPKSTNKYRYLVFFDDGYAQYVIHKHIFLVCESSPRVWEDIPPESRDFVRKYMESYPERPMVKLQQGQVVKTEWNGKWWVARVKEVDASLVQMHFDADNRTEWIYRGSARLGPLYLEFMKANLRQQGCHSSINTTSRHRGALTNKNGPYVEYTSTATDEREALLSDKGKQPAIAYDRSSIPSVPQQSRAVAKKSTAKRPSLPESITPHYPTTPVTETKSSHSIVYYQTQNKIKTKKFVPHKCGPKCVESITFTPDDLRGYSPLSIPLLCGWNRQICKFPKAKKVIVYQAPCGVRLRNMEELHRYLRITKCPMSVDLFEFDHWVHCLAEFVLDKCFVNIKDLSYGVENVPIPCVNELDHAYPDTIKYTTQREPSEDVRLNLDQEFLCCCDCTDDCADKNKCQCWQLTIQGATLGGRVPNAAVGYVYKRLPEAVTTGIYECNSRCKCSVKTCLNRVVQHPLNLKLQVFKTAPRGWGIRCLNDIPLGSFICIYAGRLLTEQGANEGGKNYGDEYLAELDYVEVVEGIKEGYEAEVLEPLDEEPDSEYKEADDTRDDLNDSEKVGHDSDDDYNVPIVPRKLPTVNDDNLNTSSIRSRLRKRTNKKDENAALDKSEDSNQSSSTKDGTDKGSDDEEAIRAPSKFDLFVDTAKIERANFKSVRDFYGEDEAVYIMDAKTTGNIGRYLNHSCDPNVFVQNVFVDTHDLRFPWVAFFALTYIRAGQELTWNYSYDVGSIPGKSIPCMCGSSNCRGRLL
ncbi:hypothetical protein QAD02_023244 [Eretmocerus hayati]|uniref:Uncharacterized protein n=1 Tax=Eretmocerus hayati TaxID=131215 RepID=A0ACC2Q066_9HYME|nr:hypothetical protein QAD02_023244 [Eretmocerus hayati]